MMAYIRVIGDIRVLAKKEKTDLVKAAESYLSQQQDQ